MNHTRLTALLLGALLLAGCNGGGDDTVDKSTHELLQYELDETLAELMTERDARQAAETTRQVALAEVSRLRAQIGNLNDAPNAAETASLYARFNHATAEVTRLTDALATATAEVTELTGRIGSAGDAESLLGMLEAEKAKVVQLTAALEAANTALNTLRGQLTTAQTELQAETQRATEAEQQAQEAQQRAEEAAQQTQAQEANQRADNLKTELESERVGATAPPVPNITMTVARGSLRLARSRHANASLSGNGLRSATMALTSGGDPGKTVVYTDRELSRPVLEHYATLRDSGDLTRLALTDAAVALPAGGIPHFTTTPPVGTQWRLSHGVSSSVAAVDGDLTDNDPADDQTTLLDDLPPTAENPRRANSYTGYLYGQSGQFICAPAAGATCQVQITPDYAAAAVNNRFALSDVAVISVAPQGDGTFAPGGTLYFKPSGGATYQLYEGGPVSTDDEYMMFGYWREDPTSAAAGYEFGVFADAVGTGAGATFTAPADFVSATYDGVAVGAYVEQDPNDPVDTHRQGEFTADVFLMATSGDAGDITGTVDDFAVTPTGGSAAPRTASRWVVTLHGGTGADKTVSINLGAGGAGLWTHEYVPTRTGSAETVPPAVTGVFDVKVADFLHLVGAYGAER